MPSAGPLRGIRVLELAGIGPAPHAMMMLADMGADIVRIERPDNTIVNPRLHTMNRGRRSVILDLKRPQAVSALLTMVERADVLVEGLRPGVTERLGVGPADCLGRNPRLIYARMTGWGQTGPLARAAGHDLGYIARTGALHASGQASAPQFAANLLGDFGGGGMLLALGICAALVERQGSGQGQVIDAAIVDGVASLMAMPWMWLARDMWRDERGVNELDGGAPYYSVYETSDGQHVAVGALEPQFYANLLRGLELDEVPDRDDPTQWPKLREIFASLFMSRTRDEWTEHFLGKEACVEPVLSMTEAVEDEHLASRGTYFRRDGHVEPAPSPRFSRTPGAAGDPAAIPGEHTLAVLHEWGVPDPEALCASGAAVQIG